ncbi:hypothetical protein CHCC20333_0096 [Bacillus paralicheniformis]|nr:hypothetical protein CHCC20333_0096 [Bacillus paralicheniformis]
MIIQYNGFTPLRIVLKYQLFLLCLLRWYSFAFSGNQSSTLGEREQAQKNHKAKPGVQQERRQSFQWQTLNRITSYSMIKAYVFKNM